MEGLTIQQALEQGYKFCSLEDGDRFTPVAEMTPEDLEDGEWYLAEKEGLKFKLPTSKVKEALLEMMDTYMEDQYQVDDEGELYGLLEEKGDFDTIAALINKTFEERTYYDCSGIPLIREADLPEEVQVCDATTDRPE